MYGNCHQCKCASLLPMTLSLMTVGGWSPVHGTSPISTHHGNTHGPMLSLWQMRGKSYGFSRSNVMTYRSDSGNDPHITQSSSSSMWAPDGTRLNVDESRDSSTGQHRRGIGCHTRDHGYVMDRMKNVLNGDYNEDRELINMDEGQ